jgi:hypothetical protein
VFLHLFFVILDSLIRDRDRDVTVYLPLRFPQWRYSRFCSPQPSILALRNGNGNLLHDGTMILRYRDTVTRVLKLNINIIYDGLYLW